MENPSYIPLSNDIVAQVWWYLTYPGTTAEIKKLIEKEGEGIQITRFGKIHNVRFLSDANITNLNAEDTALLYRFIKQLENETDSISGFDYLYD